MVIPIAKLGDGFAIPDGHRLKKNMASFMMEGAYEEGITPPKIVEDLK